MVLPQVMVLDKVIYWGPFDPYNCWTWWLWELIDRKVMEKSRLVLATSLVILREKHTYFAFLFSKTMTPISHLSFDDDLSFKEVSQSMFDFLIIHYWLWSRCLLPIVNTVAICKQKLSLSHLLLLPELHLKGQKCQKWEKTYELQVI